MSKKIAFLLFSFSFLILLSSFSLFLGFRSPASMDELLDYERNNVEIFERNKHCVVNVTNIQLARHRWSYSTIEVPRGSGSGFVWDLDGHIITNFHVVDGGQSFVVNFYQDPKPYRAKLIGASQRRDIAVLKLVEKPTKLSPIELYDSDNLLVGQKALAIGNPFGLDHTMTSGIISALDREVETSPDMIMRGMIQTDASINPGNSGGPLFNSQGKMIGINTMIYSTSGNSAGIGLAVPSGIVRQIVPQLIKYGKEIRPALGIQVAPTNIKDYFGVKKGVLIAGIYPENGPAAKAGLKGIWRDRYGEYHIEDVLIAINGKETNSLGDINGILEQRKVGDSVELTILNNHQTRRVSLSLSALTD